MIYIGNFRDISEKYDEIWLIVRSLKSMPKAGKAAVKHVPELSPSKELFFKYLKWREMPEWGADKFKELYVPEFINELASPATSKILTDLYRKGHWKNILLVCFCPEEEECHRSIACGVLQGVQKTLGEEVVKHDTEYLQYYEQYMDQRKAAKMEEKESKESDILNAGLAENAEDREFYLLIAGTRTYSNYEEMKYITDKMLKTQYEKGNLVHIVSGGAKGADALAEKYAAEEMLECTVMPAEWDKYGKSAGYRRNAAMHDFIGSRENRGCLCFWDGESAGTRHNFKLALENDTPIKVYNYVKRKFLSQEEIKQITKKA